MSETVFILDASALLAVMRDEEGAARIYDVLADARISAVNLSEVVAKLQERGVPDEVIDESLLDLDLHVVPFDQAQAMAAGKLRASTRPHGLSLGDRACLALAASVDGTAVTADRTWRKLDVGIRVELAR
ncbi:MAG: VapC toxin family domain ribonuclease [Rhizorhabdus sp.]|nr:VapC toxin family domain ribonuclease [Rhizorhabdus sp.]